MRLHELKPAPGSKHRKKRLGSGESSGLGKTCGKGHKGQKSRSGASIRPSFEGGQMPLNRRLPKRGFNNAQFKVNYAIVNVSTLDAHFEDGATVNEETLRELGLVKGVCDAIKVLGEGELSKKLTVSVNKLSGSAREKIEKAGGKVEESPAEAAPEKKADEPAPAAESKKSDEVASDDASSEEE
ncbi:MAG: 50S ribosomal protein L15 [Verrucomicrobiales bacterium]|nr:50S ribosomal protein L15 [Verrucomicrobiales bacterium]